MEAFFAALLSDPRLHVIGFVLLAMIFRCRVKRFFCGDLIRENEILRKELEAVKAVQVKREEHYKEIPLMKMEIDYLKEGQSKSDERYNVLDKKIDDLTTAVAELAALVKQDLENKRHKS